VVRMLERIVLMILVGSNPNHPTIDSKTSGMKDDSIGLFGGSPTVNYQ
jgi:hypothetical protein